MLRAAVDVLSMSATPIPRTLEMAITGIREMSTIATPPEERHPVLSFVGPYEDRQVVAAIRRAEQALDNNPAGHVLVPDEILHIQAVPSDVRQGKPRGQGIVRLREHVDPRQTRMRRNPWPHHCRQWSTRVGGDRRGRGA